MATPEARYKITARDRSKRAIRSAIRGFKNLARSVLSVRGAVVLLAGAGGLALLIRQSLKATDEIAKFSQRLGISTEALSELKFVGKLAGIEFNQFSIALQRMIRRVAEVATGTGEASVAMRDLGLDALELLKLSPDKQFETIAESLAGLENNAERVRLAFKFFDSEGVALIQTMARGGKGIAEFRAEARRLGVSVSADMAANVEKASDEIIRFTSLIGGLRDQTVGALSPAITLVATKFKGLILSLTDEAGGVEAFSQRLAESFLNIVETVIVTVAEAVNAITKFFSDVDEKAIQFNQKRREELVARAGRSGPFVGLAERGNIAAIKTLENINLEIASIDRALVQMKASGIDIDQIRAVFADLRGELGKSGDAATAAGDALTGGPGGAGLIGVRTLTMMEKLGISVTNLRAQTKALADEGQRGLEFARAWQQAAEMVRMMGANATQTVAEVAALILEQLKLNEAIAAGSAALKKAEEDAKDTTTEMTVFAEQASKNMQDVFAEFLFDPFDEGLKGMLKGFVDVLRRMVAEAIAAKVFEKIFGNFLGAKSGGGGATSSSPPGAQTGLSMTVPGTGPADSRLFAARVSPGEQIDITPRGKSSGGGLTLIENITINESQDIGTTRTLLAQHRQLVIEDIQRIMQLNGLRLRTP